MEERGRLTAARARLGFPETKGRRPRWRDAPAGPCRRGAAEPCSRGGEGPQGRSRTPATRAGAARPLPADSGLPWGRPVPALGRRRRGVLLRIRPLSRASFPLSLFF